LLALHHLSHTCWLQLITACLSHWVFDPSHFWYAVITSCLSHYTSKVWADVATDAPTHTCTHTNTHLYIQGLTYAALLIRCDLTSRGSHLCKTCWLDYSLPVISLGLYTVLFATSSLYALNSNLWHGSGARSTGLHCIPQRSSRIVRPLLAHCHCLSLITVLSEFSFLSCTYGSQSCDVGSPFSASRSTPPQWFQCRFISNTCHVKLLSHLKLLSNTSCLHCNHHSLLRCPLSKP